MFIDLLIYDPGLNRALPADCTTSGVPSENFSLCRRFLGCAPKSSLMRRGLPSLALLPLLVPTGNPVHGSCSFLLALCIGQEEKHKRSVSRDVAERLQPTA